MKRTWTWVAAAMLACGDDAEHDHAVPPECAELAARCHDADEGSGTAHRCHELGHGGGTASECAALRDECFAACPLPDGGAGDAAAADGGGT